MAFKGMSLGFILGMVSLGGVFILFVLICLFKSLRVVEARKRARDANELPQREAQRIINSLQGDWDITNTSEEYRQRITVEGRQAVNKFQEPEQRLFSLQLHPKKLPDGTLILDPTGWKAIVFTPEKGYIETESDEGIKWEWNKVSSSGPSNVVDDLQRLNQIKSKPATSNIQVSSSGPPNVVDDLQRLNQLKEEGVLTEEEFSLAKLKILHPGAGDAFRDPIAATEAPPPYPGDLEACAPSVKMS